MNRCPFPVRGHHHFLVFIVLFFWLYQVISTAIDGSHVYSGTEDGSLEVRNINRGNMVMRTNIQDGKVHSISLIKCFNILLVAGETSLHFYRPDLVTGRWTKLRSDFMMRMGSNKHLSVFGPRFCASDSDNVINVFEIFYVGQIVRTSLISEIKQVSEILFCFVSLLMFSECFCLVFPRKSSATLIYNDNLRTN